MLTIQKMQEEIYLRRICSNLIHSFQVKVEVTNRLTARKNITLLT